MIKITFLGTGGSTPTKGRGLPSMALEYGGSVYLFDCGEGTQRQAMQYGVNIARIKAIFLSHAHGDHILGVAGLVRTLALNKRQAPLYIFIPEGEEEHVNVLLTFDRALIGYPIIVKGIRAGIVYKEDNFTVSSFRVKHNVPTVGFVFKENDRIRFIKDKCKALGIRGEMFKELAKKGSMAIKGKRVALKQVTYEVPGKSVVYATDTRPTANTINAARNADVLVHETSFSGEHGDLAKERFHSTSVEAAEIAKKARCKALVLFHMSARYKEPKLLEQEAKKVFKNTSMASDGMVITL